MKWVVPWVLMVFWGFTIFSPLDGFASCGSLFLEPKPKSMVGKFLSWVSRGVEDAAKKPPEVARADAIRRELREAQARLKVLSFYHRILSEVKNDRVLFLRDYLRNILEELPTEFEEFKSDYAQYLLRGYLRTDENFMVAMTKEVSELKVEIPRIWMRLSDDKDPLELNRKMQREDGREQMGWPAFYGSRRAETLLEEGGLSGKLIGSSAEIGRALSVRGRPVRAQALEECVLRDMEAGGMRAAFWEGVLFSGEREPLLERLKPHQDPVEYLRAAIQKRIMKVKRRDFICYGEVILAGGEVEVRGELPKPYEVRVQEKREADQAAKEAAQKASQVDPLESFGIALTPFKGTQRSPGKMRQARAVLEEAKKLVHYAQLRELLEIFVDRLDNEGAILALVDRLGEPYAPVREELSENKTPRQQYFEMIDWIESTENRLRRATLNANEIKTYRMIAKEASENRNHLKDAVLALDPRVVDLNPTRIDVKRTVLQDLREGKKAALFWMEFFQVDRDFWEDRELVTAFVTESWFKNENGRKRYRIKLSDWILYQEQKEEGFVGIEDVRAPYYSKDHEKRASTGENRSDSPEMGQVFYASLQPQGFLNHLKTSQPSHANTMQRRVDQMGSSVKMHGKTVRGWGIFEIRLDMGPGYRVYYQRNSHGDYVILRIGLKRDQQRDKKVARALWDEILRLEL